MMIVTSSGLTEDHRFAHRGVCSAAAPDSGCREDKARENRSGAQDPERAYLSAFLPNDPSGGSHTGPYQCGAGADHGNYPAQPLEEGR